MKEFRRDGDLLKIFRDWFPPIITKRFKSGGGEKWTPAFAVTGEPFTGNFLLTTFGGPHDRLNRFSSEPFLHLFMQGIEIETTRLVIAREVDVFPDPVDIHRGVDAVVLKERNRNRRNRGRFNVRESPLQDGKAGDSDNRFDLSGLDQRHHDRRAFRDEHGVAETFRFILKILNRAKTALLTQKAEFVEGSRALVLDPKAFRHEEKTSLVRDLRESLPPHLIVQADGSVVEIGLVAFIAEAGEDNAGVNIEFLQRHRRNRILFLNVFADRGEKLIPLDLRLRNVFLRRTKARRGDRHRLRNLDGLDGVDRRGHRKEIDSTGYGH